MSSSRDCVASVLRSPRMSSWAESRASPCMTRGWQSGGTFPHRSEARVIKTGCTDCCKILCCAMAKIAKYTTSSAAISSVNVIYGFLCVDK